MNTNMKKTYSGTRKALSREFLASYSLNCKLREVSGFDENANMTTSPDIVLPEMNPYNDDLQPGQIRLLSQTDELTYAVLLRRWGENAFVVAPFSRFSYPATDEELKTRFDGGLYLQVLQIWNVRTALDATLKKSWLIGTMPADDIEDAWKLWEWSLGGAEPEDSVLERTGVPIYRPDDPRLEYRGEECDKFAKFDAEDIRHAIFLDAKLVIGASVFARRNGQAADRIALAAAEGDKYSMELYRFSDSELMLEVEYSPHDKKLTCTVLDKNGRKTGEMDGCEVVEETNGTIGTFAGGVAEADIDSVGGGIVVIGKDGDAVELELVKD